MTDLTPTHKPVTLPSRDAANVYSILNTLLCNLSMSATESLNEGDNDGFEKKVKLIYAVTNVRDSFVKRSE